MLLDGPVPLNAVHLPEKLKTEFVQRVEGLISEGKEVQRTFKNEVEFHKSQFGSRYAPMKPRTVVTCDRVAFTAWKTKCINLGDTLLTAGTELSQYLHFRGIEMSEGGVEIGIGYLSGLQNIVSKDWLGNLGIRIEAEIASNYMEQAEALLGEGIKGRYDHVPAAALSGAVLEKALKTLCTMQNPPVPLLDHKDRPKMLNLLIADLRKAGLYNETKAKQLLAWADIRNRAAHGDFDQFQKTEVEAMVKGIGQFLAQYLE
jgi:hypothetical protein